MSKPMMARCPDYQLFELDADGNVSGPGPRMAKKLTAIPLPDMHGKRVLDIGCDFGFWTFLASNMGADTVVGIDRNRPVNGEYFDLIASNNETAYMYPSLHNCFFHHMNIGKQWEEFGQFDVVFLFSLYHHIFENCGDHRMIWFWLWRHCAPGAVLLWENPTDVEDGVSHAHISKDKHHLYTREQIIGAAEEYFDCEYVGPALHEKTRHVYRFTPKASRCMQAYRHLGKAVNGAGGATKAFLYDNGRRREEIERALAVVPFPGSLNVNLDSPFDYNRDYYRVEMLDVTNRHKGFDSAWEPRQCRFYPVKVNGDPAYVMRFEGEDYPERFIEIISPYRIRDILESDNVVLERP